jgi:integrase
MRKVWQTRRKGIPGVYVEWYDDTKRRRSKYFAPKHKEFVKIFIRRKFLELNSEIAPTKPEALSWQVLKQQYLTAKHAEIKPKTYKGIKLAISRYEKAVKPSTSNDVTQSSITQFRAALDKLAENSKRKYLRDIRTFANWCYEQGYIPDKLKIKRVQSTEKQGYILSGEEIKRLIDACPTKQWSIRLLLALSTGLRLRELGELKISDINLSSKNFSRLNRKSGKITQSQPLPKSIVPELEDYITSLSPKSKDLFPKKFSKRTWNKIRKTANLEQITFHDLRRTFASRLADANVPIALVKEFLKHSSIETTMKHYIRTQDSEARKAINKLDFPTF